MIKTALSKTETVFSRLLSFGIVSNFDICASDFPSHVAEILADALA